MKILLTGVTSFSGAWFADAMISSGLEIVGFTRNSEPMTESQLSRITWLRQRNEQFTLVSNLKGQHLEGIDVLCLHGTATLDYRDPNFDTNLAVKKTLEVSKELRDFFEPTVVIHTGTFSERDESIGELPRKSFNNYSESKSLIYEAHQELFRASKLIKYVMPNPFGPLEPAKFTDYLLKSWAKNEVPIVNTPNYVRDNVPIDLLAKHYAEIALNSKNFLGSSISPSKYIESVGQFSARYAKNINQRCGETYEVSMKKNHEYQEPRIRVNLDYCEDLVTDWDEEESWDQIAADAVRRIANYSKT